MLGVQNTSATPASADLGSLSQPVVSREVAIDELVPLVTGQLIPVVAHAVAVFGDEKKAGHWLFTPLPLFEMQSPSVVLTTQGGIERVEQVLTRIEHNIPA